MTWPITHREMLRFATDMSGRPFRSVEVETQRTQKLMNWYPSYTDDRFREAQTIWKARGSTLRRTSYGTETVLKAEYAYSDRLLQHYGWEKDQAAREAAKGEHTPASANFYEAYLRHLLDDPNLRLVHILAGVNVSNGYPYHVYGYVPGVAR